MNTVRRQKASYDIHTILLRMKWLVGGRGGHYKVDMRFVVGAWDYLFESLWKDVENLIVILGWMWAAMEDDKKNSF